MTSILIVDDEALIRRGLESMIPWERLDCFLAVSYTHLDVYKRQAIYLALHIPSQNRTVHFVIIHFHRYPPFCYSSPYISVGIKKGSWRSQHASQWVPPGTILLVTITSLLSKIFASLESCPATFGRCLPSSEP